MHAKATTRSKENIDVYLEVGSRRTFAGAIDWPGWCRGGRDEAAALASLVDYGARYARVVGSASLGFKAPADASDLTVAERVQGNATTDFGAPAIAPASDARPVSDAELSRLHAILRSCWRAFDGASESAQGKQLRKGPRGGGRDLESIIHHVLEADGAYLGRLGWKFESNQEGDMAERLRQVRQVVLKALESTVHTDSPKTGPRGGARWQQLYFVRRVAWHVLDHAWEIEDRIT